METLLLTRTDIAEIVGAVGIDRLMDETISALIDACKKYDPDAFSIPVRSGFSYNDKSGVGLVEWMPAIRYGDRVVVKLVGYHPENPHRYRMPTVLSTIVTFNTQSGHADSVIDGTFLTSLRTGAASAVASSVLAAPQTTVLGLIGVGAQAVTQLHALSRVFDFSEVLIYDTDEAACKSFSSRVAHAGISIPICVSSMDELLARSGQICTSTSIGVGKGPLLPIEISKVPSTSMQ